MAAEPYLSHSLLPMASGDLGDSSDDFGRCSSSRSHDLGGDNGDGGLDARTAGHTCAAEGAKEDRQIPWGICNPTAAGHLPRSYLGLGTQLSSVHPRLAGIGPEFGSWHQGEPLATLAGAPPVAPAWVMMADMGMVLMMVVVPGLVVLGETLLMPRMVGLVPAPLAWVVVMMVVGLPSAEVTSFRIVPAGRGPFV